MLPSFIVILRADPTRILVMSQVLLLSFGIALALVLLLIFTSNATLVGRAGEHAASKTDWLDNCRWSSP